MSTNHEEMGRKAATAYVFPGGRRRGVFPDISFSTCFGLVKLKGKANNCPKQDILNLQA